MNNFINLNPIEQIQILLNQLTNYINQVNLIISQINNIINTIPNSNFNLINNNFNPLFNDRHLNFHNNLNENLLNFQKKTNNTVLNVNFNLDGVSSSIYKIIYPSTAVNLIIDHDITVKEMIDLFYQKISKNGSILIPKNDFSFRYRTETIDKKSITKISDFFGFKDFNQYRTLNFRIYANQKGF